MAPKAAASLCSINKDALNAQIKNVIDLKFKNQPGMDIYTHFVVLFYCIVNQIFHLWTDGSRNLKIQKLNGGTLNSEKKVLETLGLGNGNSAKTGSYLAYRPRFKAYHKTGLGAIFLNLKKLFPCSKSARPICGRFTFEEDGFLKGKALIEAADSGGDLKVFG